MKKSWWIAIAVISIFLNLYLSYSLLHLSRKKALEIGKVLHGSKDCQFIAVLFIPKNTCYPVDMLENELKNFKNLCVERKIFQKEENKVLLKYTGFSPALLLFTGQGDLVFSIPLEKNSSQETLTLLKLWISRLEAIYQKSQ